MSLDIYGTTYAVCELMAEPRVKTKTGVEMDNKTLRSENLTFAETKGISENNRSHGFKPAFMDKSTGRIEIARQENGQPATMHLICWLPIEWATSSKDGRVDSLKPEIISGFELDGAFYTRDEAAKL